MAELVRGFRLLNAEQRAAAVGAVLLAVSTIGPFSFVEAAEILVALGTLALLRARALGKRFHLPFGDGTVIAAAGIWAGGLILVRLFDRPLGQNLLALACATILIAAGARERAKRPPDDVPSERGMSPLSHADPGDADAPASRRRRRRSAGDASTTAVLADEEQTEPLPPPEFEPYRPEPGQQLRLGGEDDSPRQPPGEG